MFKTIKEEIEASITEKKSKFICHIYHIESVEEAEKKLEEIRKKYHDARHNCYAYKIEEGDISKASDDGEPSGTAGVPMLNILNGNNLSNILVVVTRYFGGILLGTGGLVRAYTGAMQEALSGITEINKDIGIEVKFEVTYSDLEKLKYYLKQNEIKILDMLYLENVDVTVETTSEKLENIEKQKENLNFIIIKKEILKEKYIEI